MSDETTEVAHYNPPERVRVLRFAGDDTRHRIRRGRLTKSNGNGAIYSRSVEESDPFLGQYNRNNLIVAPYAFINLYKIFEKSDALQGNVAAYIQNIDGFGYKLNFLGDDYTQKDTDQAKADFTTLSNFFDWPNDEESFMSIRKKCRMDYEVCGNAAIEVIRNLAGEIQMLHYMPIRSVRMSKLDSEMTTYNVDLMRKGIKRSIPRQKRFRRYAQIPQGKRAPIWFNEFGDPRPLDYRTGEYKQRTKYMATELLWFKQHFAGYPYGLPRWIGATLEVLGRTSAQFVNYDLFKNQGIPPMIITVSNGVLTEESLLELEDMVDGWRGEENFNRAGLLEAVPESTGMDDKGNAKIDIKMLTEQRKEDAMFKNYLEHSEVAIRKCFRLPPLYVGGTEEFNKATAIASIMVAEQQVFAPERNTFDEKINVALVQKEFGIKDWAYRTKGPQVVGSDEITKGVANFAKVGAISINYAIDMANRAFGLEMSRYPYKWANLPLFMVQEMIKAGVVLTGLDGTAEVSENAKKAILGINTEQQVTKALPPGQEEVPQKPPVAKWEQTVFPHIQEAKKQDLFSEEERELYRRLLIIDDSVKRSLIGDEITDEHYEL